MIFPVLILFHMSVKKLIEKSGSLITRTKLISILTWGSNSPEPKDRIAQRIYSLCGEKKIDSLGHGIFYIQDINHPLSREKIIEWHYWSIVKILMAEYGHSGSIIWWEKSLELIMRDHSLPEVIIIYTPDMMRRIELSPHHAVHFRTLKTGGKTGGKNAYSLMKRMSESLQIEGERFTVLQKECALLDSLTIRSHTEGITETLVLRFLKRYGHTLSREILWILTQYRYIRAINRLRAITKRAWYDELYSMTLDIIKNEWWWCFLSL